MNLDLFADEQTSLVGTYRDAMQAWLKAADQAGQLRRKSSTVVYDHMWFAFTAWAVGKGVAMATLSTSDLAAYLQSRGGAAELTYRYAWRLLRLVDRVQVHHATTHDLVANRAAAELLAATPHLRYANSADTKPSPEFLAASEAKRLVTYLSAVRPRKAESGQAWQEVRNRAAVGLNLGAGLTPGEVRALELADVVVAGGTSQGVPWKLAVAGDGNSGARETPVAPWAGQLLKFWLEVRTEHGIPGTMVFPATKGTGRAWGKDSQYASAKDVLQAAGIDEVDGGSFRLRHTFALRQLRRGKTAEEVARWLGVSDPAVMTRYERVIWSPVDVV
jgi:integrase